MKPEELIHQIESLIQQNELIQAAEMLKAIFVEYGDDTLINDSILISSRINIFLNQVKNGIKDYSDKEFNSITLSMLNQKSAAKSLLSSGGDKKVAEAKEEEREKIIEEKFDEKEGVLYRQTNEESSIEIKNRRLFVEHFREDFSVSFLRNIEFDTKGKFHIKLRMTFLGGKKSSGFGLRWGSGEGINCFCFSIAANGMFHIVYFIDGDEFSVCDWTETPAIREGRNSNLLEVIKVKEMLHYKINDELVYTSEFLPFFGYEIGFILFRDVRLAIDSFQISC